MGGVTSVVIYLLLTNHQIKNLIAILGSILSLLYFLQKQKLEDLQLFRSLSRNSMNDTME